jgi:lactoylglutathione lyase
MFQETFPIVSTTDLPRALAFYRDGLGCEVTYVFPAPMPSGANPDAPPEGDPVYVSLRLGESSIGLGADPDTEAANNRFALWVYVDDCDRAVEHLVAYGARVTEEPADQPWGERIARLTDPDGNRLVIGARAARS